MRGRELGGVGKWGGRKLTNHPTWGGGGGCLGEEGGGRGGSEKG